MDINTNVTKGGWAGRWRGFLTVFPALYSFLDERDPDFSLAG